MQYKVFSLMSTNEKKRSPWTLNLWIIKIEEYCEKAIQRLVRMRYIISEIRDLNWLDSPEDIKPYWNLCQVGGQKYSTLLYIFNNTIHLVMEKMECNIFR